MNTQVQDRLVLARNSSFSNRQFTVQALSTRSAQDLLDLWGRVGAALVLHAWHTVEVWRARARSRGEIRSFDERMMRDVGMTVADARRELHKYFWQE